MGYLTRTLRLSCAVLVLNTPLIAFAQPLGLAQAVRMALENDPDNAAVFHRAEAQREAAVADAQWSDPTLRFGVANLPLDSFDFNDQPMTQKVIGISQRLPRGNSARLAGERGELVAEAGFAAVADAELRLQLMVSESFLTLAEQLETRALLGQNRRWLAELVDYNRARLASAQIQSQQLLQSQLALARLDDRLGEVEGAINRSRGTLSRWLESAAWGPVDTGLPGWTDTRDWLAAQTLPVPVASIEAHPALQAAEARIEVESRQVAIANEAYKPQWGVDLSYGQRDETPMSDGSDFFSAMVSVDLPLFTGKRQDRRVAAARARESAGILQRQGLQQQMHAGLNAAVAAANTYAERLSQYRGELLAQADHTADAVLAGYAANTADLDAVIAARMDAIEAQISARRIEYGYYRALARIRYYLAAGQQENTK